MAGPRQTDLGYIDIDYETDAVVVYRKKGTPDPGYPRKFNGLPVTFATTLRSGAEMQEGVDDVWAHRGDFTAAGIDVTGVSTGWDEGGKILIYVKELKPNVLAIAEKIAPGGEQSFVVVRADAPTPLGRSS